MYFGENPYIISNSIRAITFRSIFMAWEKKPRCYSLTSVVRRAARRARPPPLFEVIIWRLHFHEFSREKSTEMTNALPNTSVQVKNTYDDAHDKLYWQPVNISEQFSPGYLLHLVLSRENVLIRQWCERIQWGKLGLLPWFLYPFVIFIPFLVFRFGRWSYENTKNIS